MMFNATSILGWRKRNEPNKRLYDRDFDQALVDDREVPLRSRVGVWESGGAAGIAACSAEPFAAAGADDIASTEQ